MADNLYQPEYWEFIPLIILWLVWCICIGGAICSLRCFNGCDGIRRQQSHVNVLYVPISSSHNLTVEGIFAEEETSQNARTVEDLLAEEETAV